VWHQVADMVNDFAGRRRASTHGKRRAPRFPARAPSRFTCCSSRPTRPSTRMPGLLPVTRWSSIRSCGRPTRFRNSHCRTDPATDGVPDGHQCQPGAADHEAGTSGGR
jgi:hypothetical protein